MMPGCRSSATCGGRATQGCRKSPVSMKDVHFILVRRTGRWCVEVSEQGPLAVGRVASAMPTFAPTSCTHSVRWRRCQLPPLHFIMADGRCKCRRRLPHRKTHAMHTNVRATAATAAAVAEDADATVTGSNAYRLTPLDRCAWNSPLFLAGASRGRHLGSSLSVASVTPLGAKPTCCARGDAKSLALSAAAAPEFKTVVPQHHDLGLVEHTTHCARKPHILSHLPHFPHFYTLLRLPHCTFSASSSWYSLSRPLFSQSLH